MEIEREREHQLSLETLKLKQKAYHARVQGKISRIWFATKTKTRILETIRKEAELEKQEGERHHRQRVRSEVKRLISIHDKDRVLKYALESMWKVH